VLNDIQWFIENVLKVIETLSCRKDRVGPSVTHTWTASRT